METLYTLFEELELKEKTRSSKTKALKLTNPIVFVTNDETSTTVYIKNGTKADISLAIMMFMINPEMKGTINVNMIGEGIGERVVRDPNPVIVIHLTGKYNKGTVLDKMKEASTRYADMMEDDLNDMSGFSFERATSDDYYRKQQLFPPTTKSWSLAPTLNIVAKPPPTAKW